MRSVVVSEIGGGTRDDLFLQCQVKTGVYGPDVQRAGEATATYKAPPRDRVQKLARHCVLQPRVPELVKLMELVAWRRGILYAMGPEGMAAADTGLAHLDKGMADEEGCESFVVSCVTKKASSSTAILKSMRRCYSRC